MKRRLSSLPLHTLHWSLLFLFAACAVPQHSTGNKIGNKAPEILCDGVKGDCDPLSSLEGKMVLIEFWASTCDPCRDVHFEMDRLYRKYQQSTFKDGKGFTIYSVAIDQDHDQWEQAVKEDRVSWDNQLCDPRKWNAPAILDYEINSLPKYFLVDGDGVIVDRALLINDLDKVLAEYQVR